jgi:branched-chain amino acid transport system substrate-binding protein
MSWLRLSLLTLVLFATPTLAQTPSRTPITITIGAVLSLSGANADVGRVHEDALRALEPLLRREQIRTGIRFELVIADDASTPTRAVREARRLVDEGAHALICCSHEALVEAMLGVADELGVLTLVLTGSDRLEAALPFWMFAVPPDSRTLIQRMVLDLGSRGGETLALMAPDNAQGDVAQRALELLLSPGGLRLVAAERYPANATVLTPEALWVATRQPSAVLVWGSPRDTQLALEGLSRRGYEGPIYLNPQLVETRNRPPSLAPYRGVLVSTSPARFAERLGPGAPTAEESRAYLTHTRRLGLSPLHPEGAYAWDAVKLLGAAAEQALTFGFDPRQTRLLRQALRDALIGMPPHVGAAGVYDFSEQRRVGVRAHSLAIARVTPQGLELLP